MPDHELTPTWNRVATALREDLGDFTFHISVAPLEPAGLDAGTLFLKAPDHIRGLVRERYTSAIAEAAQAALGEPLAIEIVAPDWVGGARELAPGRRERTDSAEAPFNPRYSFDQFVIGDGNRLAHAAALVVAEMPAQAYNPLFICGPPGLGKTHLLHAIGAYVNRYGDDLSVRYATGEAFTGAFVGAIRRGDAERFRDRFRNIDVLLLDDVQFLAEKTRTEEELFHTFNELYESGRQLVLTSDRRPDDLEDLEDRLRERFGCGLVAELEPPGFVVRRTILRKRAAQDGLTMLDEATLDEIARQVTTSVRSLEGALVRVAARCSLLRAEPSVELVRDALGSLDQTPISSHSLEHVLAITAEAFGLPTAALTARDRRPKVTFARQVGMFLARDLTSASLPAIGAAFGGRHHSTVLHAHDKIRREIGRDTNVHRTVEKLRRELV